MIVITKVADPKTGGNLATAIADVWIKVEQGDESNGWLGKFVPVTERLGAAALNLYLPVFNVGEVLVLDANDRDQFGRKPSKWDIEYEWFDNADDAFRRAKEVASEKRSSAATGRPSGDRRFDLVVRSVRHPLPRPRGADPVFRGGEPVRLGRRLAGGHRACGRQTRTSPQAGQDVGHVRRRTRDPAPVLRRGEVPGSGRRRRGDHDACRRNARSVSRTYERV